MVSGNSERKPKTKGAAIKRTAGQTAALEAQKIRQAEEKARKDTIDRGQMLAQIVNLMIGGMDLATIGASIGMTADEVDRLLLDQTSRYIKTQPALRTFTRNWISKHYAEMIEVNWAEATSKTAPDRLENQDRVIKMLTAMERLHGAAAPAQSEVKVEAAPETVEAMVAALAARNGQGYDASVFDDDAVDVEVLEDTALAELEAASKAVEMESEDEADDEL